MTPWRQRCEEALGAQSRADAIRFWGTSHEGRPVFDYRFEHTLAAVRLAKWLAPLAGADPDVVECAAWLHDCRKVLNAPRTPDHHAQEASDAVAGILEGTDFPPGKIPAVRHAIEHHVGLKLTRRLEPAETACLWDADKLSKLGAASLVHYNCISGGFGPVDTATILARGRHWLGLARDIAGSMNTDAGRAEAGRRLAFLEAYYEQLRREWSDPMEPSTP
ncbi:HD domain-containing protein [Mesoterricola silvestris]|uniref:Phosphohydrolase n=1 Tax=Mesoterricola silvestris TaxID=2927979 RepID=A0AA48H6A3_9BACT|nr:HD domain-containing protein [Mesoterricola silvestris]BDU72633.1 phosphohydrolase [Mesoterricola silvestris]